MISHFMFNSESVTPGHPDKLCDRISDTILDRFLARDPASRVNAECAITREVVFLAVNHASEAIVDFGDTVRDVIRSTGYSEDILNADNVSILSHTSELPASLRREGDLNAMSQSELQSIRTWNQVTEFGYACRHTPALMPLPIYLARKLCRKLTAEVQGTNRLPLTPDATAQVGVEFVDRRPIRIHSVSILVSPEEPNQVEKVLRDRIREQVIEPVFLNEPIPLDDKTRVFISTEGPRVGVSDSMHSGLTGRKTGVDSYGEYARSSESAKSGKDPWRIDRIASYAARYAAKNLVAAGLAEECEVTLSYSIGLAKPVSVAVDSYGTGKLEDSRLSSLLEQHFEFSVGGIVKKFDLQNLPARNNGFFYARLAALGQIGLDDNTIPWEQTDKAELLAEK